MIYRSNLICPDLTPHFKFLHSRVMPHSFGHDVPSDWADKADDDPVFGIYKRCGMWTHDEAAILYNVALSQDGTGDWVDIGAHTGWTTAHIDEATEGRALCLWGVDPMLSVPEFQERFYANGQPEYRHALGMTSAAYFEEDDGNYAGVCIDGDHEPGKPLEDAQNAAKHLAETGVIIFHDFIGFPVREAVLYLMGLGFKAKIYCTPHVVALCWRGDFVPPEHVPDPNLVAFRLHERMPDFPWGLVESWLEKD